MLQTAPCPAEDCSGILLYLKSDKSVDCRSCGRRHVRSGLKPGVPVVKVAGLSTYHCKLISPLLTRYGIDKAGNVKSLQELKNCSTFDCSWLGDRSFCIEPQYVDVPGYGRDISGSAEYLSGTLSLLKEYNDNKECLIPLHVDGDGHCLVHAVSRAIVGRELFWHALRTGLKLHLKENLPQYKNLLGDFINSSEWDDIIAECDPEYEPLDNEMLGLRNVHIFGLANVLCRPILLVDSVAGMKSSGDYSALFLPGLAPPEKCKDRTGKLNRPICLAWSSSGRNHYIPLIGIAGQAPPRFPKSLLPKVWGVCQNLITDYIELDSGDCLTIGGGRSMGDAYMQKLTSAIDKLFRTKFSVDPGLVADVYYTNYRRSGTGVLGVETLEVQNNTVAALQQRRLYRCLSCGGASLQPLSNDWLRPHGRLYNLAKTELQGGLQDQQTYTFPVYGVTCVYDAKKDMLVVNRSTRPLDACCWCSEPHLRLIHSDGTVMYENGDRTSTPVVSESACCKCGFKHWWNGKEYDNPPKAIKLRIEWANRTIAEEISWFSEESDASLNSNAYQVAAFLMHKHFPGEFNSERLRQLIVDQILEKSQPGVSDLSREEEAPPPNTNADVLNVLKVANKLYCSLLQSRDQFQNLLSDINEANCDYSSIPPPLIAQNDEKITQSSSSLPNIKEIVNSSETEPPKPVTKSQSHPSEDGRVQSSSTSGTPPKKRVNECTGQGAVPKTRSLPAAQAAAAALNRAKQLSTSSEIDAKVEPETRPQSSAAPRMIRLGPGYSVMATEDKKAQSSEDYTRVYTPQWRSRSRDTSKEGSQLGSDNDSSAPASLSELARMFSPRDNGNMSWSEGDDEA